ncbi:MAG: hypothetical protein ABI591_08110 [Kofleriaceae bacterium]
MKTLILQPERTIVSQLEATGAVIAVGVAAVTSSYLWLIGALALAGIVLADWTARVELVRDGDAITITWRNVFGPQRQTALSRAAVLGVKQRDDALVLRTSDGDIALGGGDLDEVRAFVS